jgi:S-DNA-T family DNA segregation ATPase FtsK/SpoIIIE
VTDPFDRPDHPGRNWFGRRAEYAKIASLEHSELGLVRHDDPAVDRACRRCHPLHRKVTKTTRTVAVPAAKHGGVNLGYGVLGLTRAVGALWQWTTAAELSQHLATRPELVTVERERRRKVVAWTAAGCTAAVVYLAYLSVYLVGAILLVLLFGASVVERRLRRSDTGEDAGRKSIGPHPSGKAVRGAVAAAKLGKLDDIRVVGPVARDKDIAWTAVVELPAGGTYTAAAKRQGEIAGALGVGVSQLAIDPVRGHNGRVTLWCADADPLSGTSLPSSLVGRTEPFDVYGEKVLVGYDIRARAIGFSLLERSLLIGGEPGAGKSVGSNNVLCSVALDPRMPLWLVDGKGGADLSDYEDIAVRFLADPDPHGLLSIVSDAQDDMSDRYAALKRLGEKKLTGDIADELGFHQAFFHIDELQFFMASKLGDEIADALWDLVSRGRGAGWSVSAATQRPAAEVVPSKLRDILSIRWALSCTTPQASDTILGQGYASRGFNAQTIDIEEQRGGGYLKVGATPVLMRTGMLTDNQIRATTRRAYALREQAGTLPQSDARPAVRLLKAMLAVMGDAEKISTERLLEALTTQHLMAAGWDATRLADELRPLGVRPADQWIEGRNQRGYRRADVMRALDRA